MAFGWIILALYVATALFLGWLASPWVAVGLLALLARFVYRTVTGQRQLPRDGRPFISFNTHGRRL